MRCLMGCSALFVVLNWIFWRDFVRHYRESPEDELDFVDMYKLQVLCKMYQTKARKRALGLKMGDLTCFGLMGKTWKACCFPLKMAASAKNSGIHGDPRVSGGQQHQKLDVVTVRR